MIDSHSQDMNEGQLGALEGSRRAQTSAVMLGIALSFGATAPLLSEPELALAAGESAISGLSAVDSDADLLVPRLTADTADSASTTYHTVEEGESLWQIAEQHHADVQAIKAANGISPEEVLRVGQVIRVPGLDLATTAEAVDGPRLALSTTVRGGVGGDLSIATPKATPLLCSPLQN
ncbi:MAG: LysM peptidoglycan-binding domain-containing protein [Leptolyngbyaceae cyanobacterium SM2_3_12]|nr:LysM peptidoglycan-binding domain-containing protein [Leptolyngbyaceae cyanobacterium SM2_3_12]